jgi:hypothetical protein
MYLQQCAVRATTLIATSTRGQSAEAGASYSVETCGHQNVAGWKQALLPMTEEAFHLRGKKRVRQRAGAAQAGSQRMGRGRDKEHAALLQRLLQERIDFRDMRTL